MNAEISANGSNTTADVIIAKLHDQLDATAPKPLYQQLVEAFNALVDDGTLVPGELFPTEKSVCDGLGLGRSTVRRALGQLVDDGRLVRRAGKGSFVAQPTLRRSLDGLYDFSSEIRAMGLRPSSRVVAFRHVAASTEIAELLGIARGEQVFEVRRLRCANDEPRTLETAYIPCALVPDLSRQDVERSLYEALGAATDATPVEAQEIYECGGLSAEEAQLFGLRAGDHCFHVRRTATNSHGQIFECTYVTAPADRNRYELTIRKDGASRPRLA